MSNEKEASPNVDRSAGHDKANISSEEKNDSGQQRDSFSDFPKPDSGPKIEPAAYAGLGEGISSGASNYADNVVFGAARGHGFAAEKANHLHDAMTGKDAKLVGGDYAKNGPDRFVDGIYIQTKYCSSGAKCIAETFENGTYRYMKDGAPMQIEVPSDMYEAAVQAMKDRIAKGQVPGVTDTQAANELVRKGHYTYKQVRNIAKFGTVEGLTYDAVNGIKLAGTSMGITAALSFAFASWKGEPFGRALDDACFEGLCVGGVSWISSVLAAQLGRTSFESGMRAGTDWAVKQMGSKVTSLLANALRNGNNIYGAAAANHVSKVLRGNVATAAVVTTVMSIDDFCSLFVSEISGAQAFKNVTKTASGVAGGSAGYLAGAAAGTAIFPGVGTVVGGIVGGVAGGAATSTLVGKGLDACIDDDSINLSTIIERTFAGLAHDYLLSETEAKAAIAEFKVLNVNKLMRSIQASDDKVDYAKRIWTPFIEEQVHGRKQIALPTEEDLISATAKLVDQLNNTTVNTDGEEAPAETASNARGGYAVDMPIFYSHVKSHERDENTCDPNTVRSGESSADQRQAEGRPSRTLGEMLNAFAHVLNDDADVYCGDSLRTKKGRQKQLNAQFSYANGVASGDPHVLVSGRRSCQQPATDPHVLIDSTVWGSADEGFYITETHIYGKGLYEEGRTFPIIEIKNIRVDKENNALMIDGKSIKWLGDRITPKMEIIVKCVQRYLAQF